MGGTTFLCCIAVSVAMAGPAFESLSAAAGTDPSMVFDGASPGAVVRLHATPFSHNGDTGGNVMRNSLRYSAFPIPVPEISFSDDNVAIYEKSKLESLPLGLEEQKIINRGVETLSATSTGKPLVDFLKKEGVEIRWKNLSLINSEPNYAEACPPSECSGKKVVYLNNMNRAYIDLFLDANPTFLAVTLAHELSHLADFKNIGEPKKGTSGELYLELNGCSTGVYIYHQLANVHIAPNPKVENKDIQLIRLHLAIRDYVNGGKRPMANDFPFIKGLSGLGFDDYINKVTGQQRKGSMSLAGVVELTYNFDDRLENPVKPASYDYAGLQEYGKYEKLSKSLGLRTADYLHWKEANNISAPNSQSDDNDSSDPGGYQDGPGVDGGGDGSGYDPHFQDGI
ncbi:MAG: hypothetical protein A2270_08725 [Elusimicrobia bacterium RIFOXYA12_FULL_51_18]|nr:MAG: hypothetical protein A2270_08725 [Elusimicrobia bacterium RIFOXYA12_FULL_51_18]